MSDFIRKMFMNQQQRAMFNAVDSVPVQRRVGFMTDIFGQYSTTAFTAQTDLGTISATYIEQQDYALKPTKCYVLTNNDSKSGFFAKIMYKKMKQIYEQGKQRVR